MYSLGYPPTRRTPKGVKVTGLRERGVFFTSIFSPNLGYNPLTYNYSAKDRFVSLKGEPTSSCDLWGLRRLVPFVPLDYPTVAAHVLFLGARRKDALVLTPLCQTRQNIVSAQTSTPSGPALSDPVHDDRGEASEAERLLDAGSSYT